MGCFGGGRFLNLISQNREVILKRLGTYFLFLLGVVGGESAVFPWGKISQSRFAK